MDLRTTIHHDKIHLLILVDYSNAFDNVKMQQALRKMATLSAALAASCVAFENDAVQRWAKYLSGKKRVTGEISSRAQAFTRGYIWVGPSLHTSGDPLAESTGMDQTEGVAVNTYCTRMT